MSRRNPSSQSHLMLTDLPSSGGRYPSLLETLAYQAQLLIRAHHDGHPDVAVLLRGHGLAAAWTKKSMDLAFHSNRHARLSPRITDSRTGTKCSKMVRLRSMLVLKRQWKLSSTERFAAFAQRRTILGACSFLLPSSFHVSSSLLRQRDRAYEAMAIARECARYRTRVAQSWCRSGRHLQRLQWRRFDHAPLSTRFIGSAGCCGRPGRSGRGALQRGREARRGGWIQAALDGDHLLLSTRRRATCCVRCFC